MYHWKDDFGQTHFTDNLGLVPDEYRDDSERALPDFESPLGPTASGNEQSLWQNRCVSCHYVGKGDNVEGLIDLSSMLIDKEADYLNDIQLVVVGTAHALDTTHSSLVVPQLSQEEIVALSKQMLQLQKDVFDNDPERE